jgi:DNA helicase II / ATP-dependent DNA helicase PcrA
VDDGPEAVLAALDPEQREVALATRGPVCVIAGAGTGKTRAIAHRVAYAVRTGVMNPGHVLAVTFTTRAAGELRGRLRLLDGPGGGLGQVSARTFHSAALRQLVHFWPVTVGGRPPTVLDSKISLLAEAARAARVTATGPELRDLATEVEWAKVLQVRPEDYAAVAAGHGRTPPVDHEAAGRVFAAYERLRRDRHLVDFESVLELTAAMLAGHPVAAAEVRDRYRYFVVDEFQDVNPLQKLLLDVWAGDRDDVCVVGDPRQTIYSFTGATSAYLTGFPAEYPHATVVRLMRNYRSTPEVVGCANRLAQGRDGQPGASLGIDGGPALVAQRAGGPPAEFTEYDDEAAEAAAVAARARQWLDAGVPARDMAVLVRVNAQSERFERAFADAGVPCQVRGAERFFDRAEVRQATGLLRAAAKSARAPSESVAAESGGAEAGGAESGGAEAAGQAPDAVAEVRHILSGVGLTREPPAGRGAARDRWESLAALAQLAEDHCTASPDAGLAGVVAELARVAAAEHAPQVEGVTVASLHAAKGLEWDLVFLPGLTEGNVPIVHAGTDAAVAEERRLLYVGVTRARQQVLLSWPLARLPGGRRNRTPSRFLTGLRPGWREARVARAKPAASHFQFADADPALVEALREWRRGVARDAGVPAYVVFGDETLRHIAAQRPASIEGLAGIPGLGPGRLDRYGAAVLALCATATAPAGADEQKAGSRA